MKTIFISSSEGEINETVVKSYLNKGFVEHIKNRHYELTIEKEYHLTVGSEVSIANIIHEIEDMYYDIDEDSIVYYIG